MSTTAVVICAIAVLYVLYKLSSTVRYYVKFTLYAAFLVLSAAIPLPLMVLKPFDPRNSRPTSALLLILCRLIGIRWKVRGIENIDTSRGGVILMNHQSILDILALAVINPITPNRATVAKRSMIYTTGPIGLGCWLWGTIFIDRGYQSARDILNKQTDAVRKQKRKIVIFPEGTRNSKDTLMPFRKGGFHVAVSAEAPIHPIVISKYQFVDHKRRRFDEGEFIISILPPVETASCMTEDIDGLVDRVRNMMQEEFNKISAELIK